MELHAPGSLRLSKRMVQLGLASRREADEWIERGWVRVDGKVVSTLGARVQPEQHVTLDPRARGDQEQRVTILLHKPAGWVSGQAEDGHEPALALIGPKTQWKGDGSGRRFERLHFHGLAPAGRLDLDSTGLLVFTQDGRIARQLVGDDSEIEKEYLVSVEPSGLAPPSGPEAASSMPAPPPPSVAESEEDAAADAAAEAHPAGAAPVADAAEASVVEGTSAVDSAADVREALPAVPTSAPAADVAETAPSEAVPAVEDAPAADSANTSSSVEVISLADTADTSSAEDAPAADSTAAPASEKKNTQNAPLPSDEVLARLRHGLELDGEPLRPAEVERTGDGRLRFVLKQGKKRQIRRMCGAVGLKVTALERVRIGKVALGDLPPGQWRYLRGDESFA